MEDNNIQYGRVGTGLKIVGFFLVAIELVFLIFVFLTFSNILEEPRVTTGVAIRDLGGRFDDLPDELRENIGNTLYDVESVNSGYTNVGAADLYVRDDTLVDEHIEVMGLRYVSFVVDIPDIRHSYRIYYEQDDDLDPQGYETDGVFNIYALCPTDSDVIYDDFRCINYYDERTPSRIVSRHLGYADFDEFIVYVDSEGEEMNQIHIVASKMDPSQEEQQRYLYETKDFVKSLGISPEIFEYIVESAPLEELNE